MAISLEPKTTNDVFLHKYSEGRGGIYIGNTDFAVTYNPTTIDSRIPNLKFVPYGFSWKTPETEVQYVGKFVLGFTTFFKWWESFNDWSELGIPEFTKLRGDMNKSNTHIDRFMRRLFGDRAYSITPFRDPIIHCHLDLVLLQAEPERIEKMVKISQSRYPNLKF